MSVTLKKAREILGLGEKATREEIKAAYRREAGLWHPDRAAEGAQAQYHARMQQVNAAYQIIVKFIEHYQYHLTDAEAPEDAQKWWSDRFCTGVWGPPPKKDTED